MGYAFTPFVSNHICFLYFLFTRHYFCFVLNEKIKLVLFSSFEIRIEMIEKNMMPNAPPAYNPYLGQPGQVNPAIFQAAPPTVVYLQPGQQVINGQVIGQPGHVTSACDQSKMPSVACPIFACLCYWPLGIGALVYYLKAQSAQGTRFLSISINCSAGKGRLFVRPYPGEI